MNVRTPQNQETLQRTIIRMCKEHPFHSLYQVYCLQPDQPTSTSRRQSARHSSPSSTQTDRGAAAGDIFNRLREDNEVGSRVRDVEQLCHACIEWAKYPIRAQKRYTEKTTDGFNVPEDLLIRKILNLKVPVMTCATAVDPTMRYDDCVWVERFESTFKTAGGVNLPKISQCIGSDGQKYKQLVCCSLFVPPEHSLTTTCSSRVKVTMICDKMQSWNRSSTWSIKS